MRINITHQKTSTSRFDRNNQDEWVFTGETERSSVKTRRSRSEVIAGDRRKPTNYEELMFTLANGPYSSRSATTKTTGTYYAAASGCSFPFVKDLTSGSPSSCISFPDASYTDPGLIEALASAAKTDFNAAVALAEARKTASTLEGLTRTLYRDLIAIKKLDLKYLRKRFSPRNKKKSKSEASSPAEAWLLYRYGIMPTVYDVQAAVKVLSTKIDRGMTVKVKGGKDFDLSDDYTDYYGRRHNILTGKGIARTMLILEINSPAYQTANEFGFANIAGVGWELIPFSFIVDWALPIGTWLKALSVLPNVSLQAGSQSWQFNGTHHINYDYERHWYQFTKWSVTYSLEGYRRKALNTVPIPLPRLQNPIRGVGDLDRVADLLSLADVLTRK